MSNFDGKLGLFALFAAGALEVACANQHGNSAKGSSPETISVSAATVQVGVKRGSLRGEANVPAFRITRFPVRVSDYAQCVARGACDLSAEEQTACPAWSDAERSSEPASCLSTKQASAYCAWVGGRLPRLAEWMLAARGSDVKLYPWGDEAPTCAQHWSGACPETAAKCSGPDAEKGCKATPVLGTGLRPGGAAPSGLEDVLLPQEGELVLGDGPGNVYHCGANGQPCLVQSGIGTPASIDFVNAPRGPNAEQAANQPLPPGYQDLQAFGFRCAWSE